MADFDKLVENFFSKKEKILGAQEFNNLIQNIVKENYSLDEGRGMPFRKLGDTFETSADPKEVLAFEKAFVFPQQGGAFETKEESKAAVEQFIKDSDLELKKQVNTPNNAAMVVVLNDPKTSKKYAFLKYFKTIKPDGRNSWSESDFGSDTGFNRSVKNGKITASSSEKMTLKSSDLIADNNLRTVSEVKERALTRAQELVNQNNLPQLCFDHIEALLDAAVNNTNSPVLVNGAMYIPTYNKYLGEILAPISLLTGWLSTGDRKESEIALLNPGKKTASKKYSASEMKIKYNILSNERLKDSTVIHNISKTEIDISSKASSGAAGSLDNLNNDLKKLQTKNSEAHSFLLKNYTKAIEILTINQSFNQYQAPIEMAKYLGLISEKEHADLIKLIADKKNFSINSEDFKKLYSETLSENIWNIINSYAAKTSGAYLPMFHLITAIANACVMRINEDSNNVYKFDEAVRTMLTNSSLVQINSQLKKVGKSDCQFTGFDVKYPPVFKEEKIKITIKSYSASSITGKFTFKIP